MNKKVAIIGSGAMGTAMAKVLADANNQNPNITVYGVNKAELDDLKIGLNSKYFPNSVKLPKLDVTTDINVALKDAKYVVIAVPSKTLSLVLADILGSLNSDSEVMIINVTKGFFPGTEVSVHEGIAKLVKGYDEVRGVVSITGPSHAEEIVKQVPTAVAAVSKDKDLIQEAQKLFSNSYFKVYAQHDVKGAMAGAAYKNVLAIASGISSGLGFGINSTAALLTRGISEMTTFVKSQGGKQETVMGLTGIGDLIVTATSDLSRNFTFGKELAKDAKKALETKNTVEGLVALDFIYKIGQEKNIELPIINFLYAVVKGKKEVSDFKSQLWERKLKEE